MSQGGKTGHRFNVIDVILLIAILAGIAGIVLRAGLNGTDPSKAESKARITILVESLLDESAGYLHEGDRFFFSGDNQLLGTVQSITQTPAEARVIDAEGKAVIVHYENRKDVRLILEISGLPTESGFLINGNNYLGVGSTYQIYSKYTEIQCTVLSLTLEE
ncbi:MAG: DUF4330 domain-containing protein [Clostridia bacterium]|nr:DUF4330 domain-containing protein [Clostridia bacterium]MBO4798946.1 DUF4330 domain-containing protein [Candidatus Methanomethylophilaceae archaeon]MBQ4290794.1 DUF4330 domain-containing protein [Clostridia bacterium]